MERGCCFSPKWVAEFGGIFFFYLKSGKQFFCPYKRAWKGQGQPWFISLYSNKLLIKAAGWISPENSMPQWRQIATWHGEIEPDSSISASRETLAQAHKQFEGVVFFFFVYGFLPPCSKAMVSPCSSVCDHHLCSMLLLSDTFFLW